MAKEKFSKEKFAVKLSGFDKSGNMINATYDIEYDGKQIGIAVFSSEKKGVISGTNMIEIRLDKESFDFETDGFVYPIIKRQNISFTAGNIKQYIESILENENNS